jgi:hypothetical protein
MTERILPVDCENIESEDLPAIRHENPGFAARHSRAELRPDLLALTMRLRNDADYCHAPRTMREWPST